MISTGSVSSGEMAMPIRLKSWIIIEREKSLARLSNIHPGEVLLEEFLIPLGITQYALARKIGVDQGRISEIIKGRRRLTPETALRLAAFFGTTPRFWLNLQDEYDLEEARNRLRTQLEQIEPYRVMKASA